MVNSIFCQKLAADNVQQRAESDLFIDIIIITILHGLCVFTILIYNSEEGERIGVLGKRLDLHRVENNPFWQSLQSLWMENDKCY